MALGTNASTSPAADSTMPLPITLTVTVEPTTTEAPPATRPRTFTLALAPSAALSNRMTVPSLEASTATTVSTAPPTEKAAGTATTALAAAPVAEAAPTTEATGNIDKADASLCAKACEGTSNFATAAQRARRTVHRY